MLAGGGSETDWPAYYYKANSQIPFPWLSCLIMQIVPDVGPSLPAVVSVVELSSGVFEKRLSANT